VAMSPPQIFFGGRNFIVSLDCICLQKKRIGSYPILFSVVAGTGLEPVSAAADMSPPGEC
jgi:hypothetical protein